jgi:phosphatidate cytidylyltransferase
MTELGMQPKNNQGFKLRTISTVIGIPVVVALIWFDTPIPWFTLLAVGWGIGGVLEFYKILNHAKGLAPLTYFGALWVLLFIISSYFKYVPHLNNISPVALLFTAGVILSLIFILWRGGKENAFVNWAWTMAGILYIGWLLSYTVALRNLEQGRGWLFLAILCTFASDIFAYLFGRTFGQHKMAPYISPNKSWEGAIAGVVGSIILSVVVVFLFKLPLNWGMAVGLGALVSLFGQLGDLVKSIFKRNMAVKDSGSVLPGHGGFLDRMDSLIFAGVLVYYFVSFISAS